MQASQLLFYSLELHMVSYFLLQLLFAPYALMGQWKEEEHIVSFFIIKVLQITKQKNKPIGRIKMIRAGARNFNKVPYCRLSFFLSAFHQLYFVIKLIRSVVLYCGKDRYHLDFIAILWDRHKDRYHLHFIIQIISLALSWCVSTGY